MQTPDATLDLHALLQELTQIVEDGRPVFGLQMIGEEHFYICTTKIRKSSPRLFGERRNESVRLLDEIEKLVENGKARFFGKVAIDVKSYQQLVTALTVAVRKEKDLNDTPQAQADAIIHNAQMQAQRIIEQAQLEAQNIIEAAKRNATPWA